jgi:hypothetical protein
MVCLRLQGELARERAEGYGFKPEEVKDVAPLQFVAPNLDSGSGCRARSSFRPQGSLRVASG